jgi:hypothetical protein
MNVGDLVLIYFGGLDEPGEGYGIVLHQPDPEFEMRTIVLVGGEALSVPTFQLSVIDKKVISVS